MRISGYCSICQTAIPSGRGQIHAETEDEHRFHKRKEAMDHARPGIERHKDSRAGVGRPVQSSAKMHCRGKRMSLEYVHPYVPVHFYILRIGGREKRLCGHPLFLCPSPVYRDRLRAIFYELFRLECYSRSLMILQYQEFEPSPILKGFVDGRGSQFTSQYKLRNRAMLCNPEFPVLHLQPWTKFSIHLRCRLFVLSGRSESLLDLKRHCCSISALLIVRYARH